MPPPSPLDPPSGPVSDLLQPEGLDVYRARRFDRDVVFGGLMLLALTVPLFAWSAVAHGTATTRIVAVGWALIVAGLCYQALAATVTRIEMEPDGACRFYAPVRLAAACHAAEIDEISTRRAGNSPYVRVRVAGESLKLLRLDRLEIFTARVRRANPNLQVRHLMRLSTARGPRRPDPDDDED